MHSLSTLYRKASEQRDTFGQVLVMVIGVIMFMTVSALAVLAALWVLVLTT